MNRRCKDFEEGLVDLAEGRVDQTAWVHVSECPDCARRLAQLVKLVEAARTSRDQAPPDLIRRAQDLMPALRRRLIARLLGSSLDLSTARNASSSEFSLHLGAEELSVRLQYSKVGAQWEIAGRAPGEGWTIVHDGKETACQSLGRFRFQSKGLQDSGFVLKSPLAEITVPPASELIDRAL